ncbi:MAG: hypothetical protein L0229_10580, partial [Blastocatellia bacterium]|nr:hypothetical protein [Blastocatellia bacterium]
FTLLLTMVPPKTVIYPLGDTGIQATSKSINYLDHIFICGGGPSSHARLTRLAASVGQDYYVG